MPTNTIDKIDEFKKKCEKENRTLFLQMRTIKPTEKKYELYNPVKKFWIQDKKAEIDNIKSIKIPNTTEMIDDDAKKHGNFILRKWESLLETPRSTQKKISGFIKTEIKLMSQPLEKRNELIKTRIERRKETAAKKDAELKKATANAEIVAMQEKQAAAIREQEVAEDLTFTRVNNSKRGTRIPKRKTTDEIIADDQIFEHAKKLYRELYHHELDADLLPDFLTVTHCDGQCSVTWPRPCPSLGSSAEAHLWACLPQADCLFEPSALACSSLLCCFSSDWLMDQPQCVHAHAWRVIVCPCMAGVLLSVAASSEGGGVETKFMNDDAGDFHRKDL
jgi:hypothetical protein